MKSFNNNIIISLNAQFMNDLRDKYPLRCRMSYSIALLITINFMQGCEYIV